VGHRLQRPVPLLNRRPQLERGSELNPGRKQADAADALEKLKKQAEGLWASALRISDPPDDIELAARRLQDEILERRRNNPLIFERVYDLLRKTREEQMNRAAEELVEEGLKALGPAATRAGR
jgi:hypothetical protein